jgi:hypothetical protein
MKNVISCKTTSSKGVRFGLIMLVERVAIYEMTPSGTSRADAMRVDRPLKSESSMHTDYSSNLSVTDVARERLETGRARSSTRLGSSGSAAAAARRAGYPWTEQMSRKMLRNVEKRGVHAAGNAPSEDRRKYWQGVELCIHGLNRWAVKCREMLRNAEFTQPDCRFSQEGQVASFPIDHNAPSAQGNATEPTHLTLACVALPPAGNWVRFSARSRLHSS